MSEQKTKLTWGDLKRQIEEAGTKDATPIYFLDFLSTRQRELYLFISERGLIADNYS